MFLNKFSIFLVFISLLGSVISCNVEEEDVNEVFTWDYVQGFGTGAITENYSSPNYTITTDPTNHKIVGYPNTQDSLVINLGNLLGSELTVGEYKLGINDFITLSFYKNGVVHEATSGAININYINSRIDFDFDVEFANGNSLTNGFGDNLLINNVDTPTVVDPPVVEVGTIESTINGAKFTWSNNETNATFVAFPQHLTISGVSISNNISMAFQQIDSPAKLTSLIGQTVQLGTLGNIINYTTTGGIPAAYQSTSGQASFVSYSNNILTMTFSGEFTNVLDATDKIPFSNGEVKAILVN